MNNNSNNNSKNNQFSPIQKDSIKSNNIQSTSDTNDQNQFFFKFSNQEENQIALIHDEGKAITNNQILEEKKEKKLKQNLKLNCFMQKKFQVQPLHKNSLDSDQSSSKSINYNVLYNDDNIQQKIQDQSSQYHQFFDEVEQLGQGFQGVVKKVFHKSSKQFFAAKIIRSDDEEIQATANNEINILKQLNHPNILKPFETFYNHNGSQIIMILELFESKSIYQYLKSSPNLPLIELRNILKIIFDLLQTVKYIHNQSFVHRDINSKNVLINKSLDQIKLIDFGIAKQFQNGSIIEDMLIFSPKSGKTSYQAPEVLDNKPYTFNVDSYQIGQLFYEMVSWRLTSSKKIINKMFQNKNLFTKGYFKENNNQEIENIKKLILQMLEVDPDKRISIEAALQSTLFEDFQLKQ